MSRLSRRNGFFCVPRCSSDTDCPLGQTCMNKHRCQDSPSKCDTASGYPGSEVCTNGACGPECTVFDDDCPEDKVCDNQHQICVDPPECTIDDDCTYN